MTQQFFPKRPFPEDLGPYLRSARLDNNALEMAAWVPSRLVEAESLVGWPNSAALILGSKSPRFCAICAQRILVGFLRGPHSSTRSTQRKFGYGKV